MSEEVKKVIANVENEKWIISQATKMAEAYAGSANANPSYVDLVMERTIHFLKTGERLD